MLDPNYLANVSIDLEKLYSQLETDILCDIARRIRQNDFSMTSTAEYQKQVLQSLGMSQSEVSKRISKTLDISNRKAKDIIDSSSYRSLDSDNVIFKEAFDKGLINSFNYNPANFKELINEGIRSLNGELKNICKSTAKSSQQAFIHACDKAYLAIQTGGLDSDTAITNVIKELSREGINIVQYKTGAIRKVDSAIRNAVRTATNQTACKCQDKNFEEMGGNLVEVSSHMGARPDHAFWQGKIYWRKEKYKNYSNFEISTAYGTGEGLGGWNCRHSFYPFFEGLSSKSFEQYRLKENEEYYNLTQEQRHNERKIREWDKRNKICAAAGVDNSKELSKVREWKNRQKQFLEGHPELKRDYARENSFVSTNKKSTSFFQETKNGKNIIFDDIIPKEFKFSNQKESNLIDSYIEVDKAYMKDKREHLSINDSVSGKQLLPLYSSSEKSHVNPSDSIIKFIEGAKDNSLVTIHNHPSKGTFSIDDVVTHLTTGSFKESLVVTNDAEIFFFSTPNGANITLRTIDDYYDFKNYVESVRERIKSVQPDMLTKEVRHKAWIEICKEKGWVYGYKKIK